MSDPEDCYLSIVVASRNDDHGGELLRRMQMFLDTLCELVARFELPAELVIVEWNPPDDRPCLHAELDWSKLRDPFRARIVEVPASIHRRYRHSRGLPLYQMIAKNVGIRRARGEFVVATNVDVLFSAELVEYLAMCRLERSRMYRLNRTDVSKGVPTAGSTDERLRYCASNILGVYSRDGYYRCGPTGLRESEPEDIVASPSAVFLADGWHEVEKGGETPFRWARDRAELVVVPPNAGPAELTIDLAPGPAVGFEPFGLRVTMPDRAQRTVEISGKCRVVLSFQSAADHRRWVVLETPGEGIRRLCGPEDRILCWRASRIELRKAAWGADDGSAPAASPLRVERLSPIQDSLRAKAQSLRRRFESKGLATGRQQEQPVADLHINACGDFTLLAREAWLELRGYPEFDCFSMNLDALLCFAAQACGYSEVMLREPLRLYHVDHAGGFGVSAAEQAELSQRIASAEIPWLDADKVFGWASQMRRLATPIMFNRVDWGLSNEPLSERASPGFHNAATKKSPSSPSEIERVCPDSVEG